MKTAPKSLRLQIGLFGRTNVGKSSLLNLVAGQDVAITSPIPGTTTDVVEKSMELLPLGPVVFLDTAGLDDLSANHELRIERTRRIFRRADVGLLITEPDVWTEFEEQVVAAAKADAIPLVIVVNKIDLKPPSESFMERLRGVTDRVIEASALDPAGRDRVVAALKSHLIELAPADFMVAPAVIGDLLPRPGLAVLIIPIDAEAPKGRIILPQVQTIRDALDHGCATLVVRESEYLAMLDRLAQPPDLVVCDSQVVDRMVKETPPDVPCTTFSILFTRLKGDLAAMVRGAAALDTLRPGDRILVAEACSHHAIEGDIGRVKLPAWINRHVGGECVFTTCAGRDYPERLDDYKLIIHCGACMITRREMLTRLRRAEPLPVTNYGVAIAHLHGHLTRVLEPFRMASHA
jgi:[FeFe] hydrogenase H-cluster maturation GTPase HydF